MSVPRTVVADIGATNTRLGVMTGSKLTSQAVLRTQDYAGDPELLIKAISSWILRAANDDIRGIGLSFAGPTDDVAGTASLTNLEGWQSPVLVRSLLSQKLADFRLDPPICMGNDATLAALAEYQYGGHRSKNLAYLTLSTGVGGGVILGGKMYTGVNGGAAEFGHIQVNYERASSRRCGCGRYGCLESEISGTAIAKQAEEMLTIMRGSGIQNYLKAHGLHNEALTASIVADMATDDIIETKEIWWSAGRYLGRGLQVIALAYNPEVIIIGGSVSNASDLFLPEAVEVFRQGFEPNCTVPVRVTTLGDQISLLGALALVTQTLDH